MAPSTMRPSGDQLLRMLSALSNPIRLRVVAHLATAGRAYISQLAREIGISRPLMHLHLQKLEEAGLVRSQLELGPEGKALNFFELTEFAIEVSPSAIARAVRTLSHPSEP